MGPTGRGFENRRRQRAILQRIGFLECNFERGYASGEGLKACCKSECNFGNIRVKNAIFPENRVLGSLGMQVEGLHAILQTWELKCNFKGKTGILNDFIRMQRTYVSFLNHAGSKMQFNMQNMH